MTAPNLQQRSDCVASDLTIPRTACVHLHDNADRATEHHRLGHPEPRRLCRAHERRRPGRLGAKPIHVKLARGPPPHVEDTLHPRGCAVLLRACAGRVRQHRDIPRERALRRMQIRLAVRVRTAACVSYVMGQPVMELPREETPKTTTGHRVRMACLQRRQMIARRHGCTYHRDGEAWLMLCCVVATHRN